MAWDYHIHTMAHCLPSGKAMQHPVSLPILIFESNASLIPILLFMKTYPVD